MKEKCIFCGSIVGPFHGFRVTDVEIFYPKPPLFETDSCVCLFCYEKWKMYFVKTGAKA